MTKIEIGSKWKHKTSNDVYVVKEQYTQKILTQVKGWPVNGAALNEPVRYEKVPVTLYRYRVSTLPFSGSISIGNDITQVTAINGYLPTHYKFVNVFVLFIQKTHFIQWQLPKDPQLYSHSAGI